MLMPALLLLPALLLRFLLLLLRLLLTSLVADCCFLLPECYLLLPRSAVKSVKKGAKAAERPALSDTRVICCLIRAALVRRAGDAGSAGSHLSPCVRRLCGYRAVGPQGHRSQGQRTGAHRRAHPGTSEDAMYCERQWERESERVQAFGARLVCANLRCKLLPVSFTLCSKVHLAATQLTQRRCSQNTTAAGQ